MLGSLLIDSHSHHPITFHCKDGLGYYDDGEERLGDEEHGNQPVKKRNGSAALTTAALKKARKQRAAVEASAAAQAAQVEEITSSNRSMWDFVQRGVSAGPRSSSAKKRNT
jgi:hypothetical protein